MISDVQPSDGEVSHDNLSQEETESTSTRCSGKQKSSVSSGKSSSKRRRSKYDILEDKFNTKLNDLDKNMDDKMEKFLEQMSNLVQVQSQRLDNMYSERSQRTSRSPERSQRPSSSRSQRPLEILERELSQRHSPARDSEGDTDSDNNDRNNSCDDDQVSIQPGHKERADFNESEGDIKSDDEILSDKSKKCLFDLFGNDALNSRSDKKTGIAIDESQKQVLSSSWRADKPNDITAFSEETKESFPVDEDTEKFLEVPSLDDMIESCLVKKYGKKAYFTKTGKSLFSQPYKMVEKIAYRGQQAAYVGILSQLYVQQSLGTLIETLSENDCDRDKVIQQTRDIFAMTTKGLDQFGRTGAFHHIIRRQLAMTDTSLFTLEDKRDISGLPLVSKGVFGDKLESTLKSNKEKKKTLDDLLPSFVSKDRKRKSKDNESSTSSAKKNCQEKDRTNSFHKTNHTNDSSSSFRIPKLLQSQQSQGFDRKNKSAETGQQKGRGGGSRGRGAGRGYRKQ